VQESTDRGLHAAARKILNSGKSITKQLARQSLQGKTLTLPK